MQAVLSSAQHPENGQVTVPLPISGKEYDALIEALESLGVGDALRQDCRVVKLTSDYGILERLEGHSVNVDELDYLAKRLGSFCAGENAKFQAMAHKLYLTDIKDFIDLTFCCQQATVITDFSDLEQIGKEHMLALNGGMMPMDQYQAVDGRKEALQLIQGRQGTITPFGVVYDNGMELEQVYDGRHFPGFCGDFDLQMLSVGITAWHEPENTNRIIWLNLPSSEKQINRALSRSDVPPEDVKFIFEDCALAPEIVDAVNFEEQNIFDLNDLAGAVGRLNPFEREKLTAVVLMAKPETIPQVLHLAENLDQFDFVSGVHTPEEYGRYMIQESGQFEYDEKLDGFYDYRRYGEWRTQEEGGQFNEYGYLAYHGTLTLEELMAEDPAEQYQQEQGPQMGGLA